MENTLLRFRQKETIETAEIEGEMVLLDMNSGSYYGLDQVGGRIWSAIAKPCTSSDIVSALLPAYEVPESELRRDVDGFLHELQHEGLIETSESAASN